MNPASSLTYRIAVAMFLAGTIAAALAEPESSDTSKATPRGIYLGGTKLGVSAEIEIDRDGQRGMVPTNFEFKTGDRFWLHLTVNQDSYVYVLNRTLTGPPAQATRGVKLMAEADHKAGTRPADSYTLVFPAPGTSNKLVNAGAPTKIPGTGLFFGMDQVPGAEKLLIIASPSPLPLTSTYFNGPGGKLMQSAKKMDSAEDVLGRLNADLIKMADNTETEEPPKSRSIRIVPNPLASSAGGSGPADGGDKKAEPPNGDPTKGKPSDRRTYATSRRPGEPMLVDLTLLHLAK